MSNLQYCMSNQELQAAISALLEYFAYLPIGKEQCGEKALNKTLGGYLEKMVCAQTERAALVSVKETDPAV